MLKKILGVALVAAIFGACQNQEVVKEETVIIEVETADDPHSFAKPEVTAVTHLDLDLNVDFEKEQLSGSAMWTLSPEHGDTVIFDTYDLNINSVTVDGKDANFALGEKNEVLGQALSIAVPNDAKSVAIAYSTQPGARALQWLAPEQTSGKKLPFLFTQSQAILARTWLPCQDGPGMRYSYNAKITVPKNMLALMSATNPQEKNAEGVYTFEMEIPIPSYLMALSVGDIVFKGVSERTGVYAEPAMLEKSAWEFANMEDMVVAAEALYGPYIWGRFDVLVLPPSFPFGGMENPRLTFATPTVVVGDRSQTALIAHELAHSWSGNLVTNKTWNDFWLNEGFTTYFEMRIMEAVYGRDYSEMIASLSHQDMVHDITGMMESEPEMTSLKMHLNGIDPDDAVGAVAYDKGYNFLRLCEETVGRERWDVFLNSHFSRNKFKSLNTEEFLAQLKQELLSDEEWKSIGVDEWIYGTGIPANSPSPQSTRFENVSKIRTEMLNAIAQGIDPKSVGDATNDWSTSEWVDFIRGLEKPSLVELEKLDLAFNFSATKNAEIKAAWMQPTISKNYTANDFKNHVDAFLISVGRRKFLTPTYRAMINSDQKDWALEVYKKARPNYHAVSRETMDDLLDYHPEVNL